MTDNPSDWPTFAAEIVFFEVLRAFFISFSIRFIPRCYNVQAECLAKKARTRRSLLSHTSSSAPVWFTLETNLFPVT